MKKSMLTGLIVLSLSYSTLCQQPVLDSTIRNGKVTVHYKIFGSGKPLLVFNGGPGYSCDHMDDFAKKMGEHFKVILFDQRGTGKSIVPQYDSVFVNVVKVLSDADLLIRTLGYSKVSVMGHSFGGILAMYFATAYPQRVEKLILSSSAGINLDFLNYFGDNISQRLCPSAQANTINTPARTTKEREEVFYKAVAANASAYLFKKEYTGSLAKMLTVPGSYSPDYNSLIWQDLGNQNYDLTKKISIYRGPALIIQGRQDIVGSETAIKIHESIKQSRLEFIEKCGHVPWLDKPDEYFSGLINFLLKK